MKNRAKGSMLLLLITMLLVACQPPAPEQETTAGEPNPADEIKPLVEKVLTAEEQAALTPDEVISVLREGNERFVNNDLTARDHSAQVRNSVQGQFPKAVVLSCLDSRVPVEDVFDRGIGDLFVARVAGNFVNEDILGSMEFGCKVAGAKLILVMGHEHCGAVKAAIDGVELGNITAMLDKIEPAVELAAGYEGERSSSNPEFVHEVCEHNVRNTKEEIRKRSPILQEMEANGEIRIVGAIYDMDSGRVTFL
jgi:carbonic anhydrase